ncbi:hypothetical protein [Sporichthya polymorpha]|uniref:hypothetical protein n=1 Tax=Sporichthya polymorpha TaxID=35751 RepID=UPI000371D4DD|nr:hypothetical protein [Sporichthya polymorpha]
MKRSTATIAAVTAAVVGIGGGAAAALLNDDDNVEVVPVTASPAATPATPSPTATDAPSEENLVRERMYFDVTGHAFDRTTLGQSARLGPCTGDSTFADVLPVQGVTRIGTRLTGSDNRAVTHQLAQALNAQEARVAANEIVSLVDECAAISGGDFGYGDPVTVIDEPDRKVVYFPAFDTDRVYGGYVVLQVGPRVGVVDISDTVPADQVEQIAKEAAGIADD